jgi:hypothetical protein
MKLLIMQFPPISRHFIPPLSYTLATPLLHEGKLEHSRFSQISNQNKLVHDAEYRRNLHLHLGPLGKSATNWPTVPAPGDYEDGEISWNNDCQGKPKY